MHVYELGQILQAISFLPAAGSGWLWARASRGPAVHPSGDSFSGRGPFADAAARQARLNSQAALCAAITAFLQAVSMLLQVLG